MERVVVTGGAGYIGAHTCKLLKRLGYEPITYDNLTTGHREFVKWGPLVIGDLRDQEHLITTFKTYKPLAVIHFAASAYVGESYSNPFKYYENNVGGTLSLLGAMRKAHIGYLVFSSTCATYGEPETELLSEEHRQCPINPYGKTKLMIEEILKDLARVQEIQTICLRYFNAAGADSEGEIGEKHEPETHLLPLALAAAGVGARDVVGDVAGEGNVLQIFGNDFPTPDGTAIRDYVHVEDLARAHILSLEYLSKEKKSDCINLGTGRGYSVLEILQALQDLGLKVRSKQAPRRVGDPPCLVADARKAKKVLNWEPQYVDIKDILKTAILWHSKQF